MCVGVGGGTGIKPWLPILKYTLAATGAASRSRCQRKTQGGKHEILSIFRGLKTVIKHTFRLSMYTHWVLFVFNKLKHVRSNTWVLFICAYLVKRKRFICGMKVLKDYKKAYMNWGHRIQKRTPKMQKSGEIS